MKKGKRLYINITNRCNTDCPFCCMFSGTKNEIDMNFEIYSKILNSCDTEFELQLEGGEPLIHPNLYLFLEYAASKSNCKKIIILTNGLLLENHLRRIVDFSIRCSIDIEIKISVNYWLLDICPDHLEKIKRYIFDVKFIPTIRILCNVRLRNNDDWLKSEIENDTILCDISNVFYLQSYGRMTDSKYAKPVIVQNIEKWSVYAVDGTDFGIDLIERSNYERRLQGDRQ